jgi:hypothetical protein
MKTIDIDFSHTNIDKNTQNFMQNHIPIFGSEMMSEAERVDYRNKIRSLPSDNERELFRLDHDQRMKLRASEIK